MGSCNFDLKALHVDISLAESELESYPEKYNTDAKKINCLLVCFDNPTKAWTAKLLINNPELKNNYRNFRTALTESITSKISPAYLKSELYKKTQCIFPIQEYLSQMERLTLLAGSSKEDLMYLVQDGINLKIQNL